MLGVVWPLLESDDTALRLIGYELCAYHDGTMGSLSYRKVIRLGVHLTSWFDADCLGKLIAGPAWRSGRITVDLIRSMAKSTNVYWRRTALVSTRGVRLFLGPYDLPRPVVREVRNKLETGTKSGR